MKINFTILVTKLRIKFTIHNSQFTKFYFCAKFYLYYAFLRGDLNENSYLCNVIYTDLWRN